MAVFHSVFKSHHLWRRAPKSTGTESSEEGRVYFLSVFFPGPSSRFISIQMVKYEWTGACAGTPFKSSTSFYHREPCCSSFHRCANHPLCTVMVLVSKYLSMEYLCHVILLWKRYGIIHVYPRLSVCVKEIRQRMMQDGSVSSTSWQGKRMQRKHSPYYC